MEQPDEKDRDRERERLKMRIAVLEENMKSCDVECKASRETVLRLVADLDRERRKAAGSAAALDSLRVELDGMALGKRSVETEKQTLEERLEASRRVIEAARRESQCLEKQVEEFERKLQISQGETHTARGSLTNFLEKVASLLQGESADVQPTEKEILHKVDNLCNKTMTEMETRMCLVSEELSRQKELQHSTLHRAQLAEEQVQDLRARLQALETELLSADMHRDGLRHCKQHYEQFLEQLSETMKLDSIAMDLDFDMRLNLILSRAEQLIKHEGSALVESKTLTYSLQRKLKSQKDQVENKALHIQFLRKKVSELEEERRGRSALAAERDDAHLEVRRLQKKLECVQTQLKASKLSNTELKAQLSHTDELKLKVMEQSQAMQEQRKRLGELVEVEEKLSAVSSNLQSQERKTRDDQQQLSTLRQSLAQLSERERELVDFRLLVSQMLGLDATNGALANYEIIKLLESLLHTHHHHHLHHHINSPCRCPTHHGLHRPQVQQLSDSSCLDIWTSSSAGPDAQDKYDASMSH